MSVLDIDAIEALLAKATPGLWDGPFDDDDYGGDGSHSVADYDCALVATCHRSCEADGRNRALDNARLIAALRNAAPELLAIARAVRAWGEAARDADDAHIAWEAQPASISLENAYDAAWERAVAARRAVKALADTLTAPAAQGGE